MLKIEYKNSVKEASESLLSKMNDEFYWNGHLSSSPVSTAVAIIALYFYDEVKYQDRINSGLKWLIAQRLESGGWGDAPNSVANTTSTLLCVCALSLYGLKYSNIIEAEKARLGLIEENPNNIRQKILDIYGDDLTFSAPILAVCSAVGLLGENSWNLVPKLPYYLAILPQRLFGIMRLPMVSYAIPALVCVGVCQDVLATQKCLNLKRKFAEKLFAKIENMQPESGGFLEAIPLTAFCMICMILSGYKEHNIVRKALNFIENQQREDASWAIDTNLCSWLTSLSVDALKWNLSAEQKLGSLKFFEKNVWKQKHKFTGASAGAFSWTNTDGGVPDADDTSAALVALHHLKGGMCDDIVENAIIWLLNMQNSDGGMPTFCKGWNKLPFDKSCADISAHAIKAFSLWSGLLSDKLNEKVLRAIDKLKIWLIENQNADGSWISLWFGENDLEGGASKVLSTAIVLEHTQESLSCNHRAADFLLNSMHQNGTWGGVDEGSAKYLLTAKAISALSKVCTKNDKLDVALKNFITMQKKSEVIGLYFAKLWYSESLYSEIFGLNALKNALVYLDKNETCK